jgi:tRNA threonylcarbamoyladenosine biosynthesis protein TsaB
VKLLVLDTAFEQCTVGLAVAGRVLERSEASPRGHARLLLPWVEELLGEAGVQLGQLDAIAFGRGPGSFTSLRIGIGVVQGLAWGAGLGVVPVSSLQAIAQSVQQQAGGQPVLVAMDARMDEVYAGRFTFDQGIARPAGHEQVCAPEQAADLFRAGDAAVGNGFERFAPLQQVAGPGVWQPVTHARAAALVALAQHWLGQHQPLPAAQAQPVYLRDQVADKPRASAQA